MTGGSPGSRATGIHHVELWVADFAVAEPAWDWLLGALGWAPYQAWELGRSWRSGPADDAAYLCLEQSADLVTDVPPDRRRVGLNHLALHAGPAADLEQLVSEAPANGWVLLFAERHPYAGGPGHYAAYLENADGFEVELVAEPRPSRPATA